MVTITIEGDVPNLTLIHEYLTPRLEGVQVDVTMAAHPTEGNLANAEWGELLLSFGAGIASSAVWDAIKFAVARARRRGPIDMHVLPEIEGDDAIMADTQEHDHRSDDDLEESPNE